MASNSKSAGARSKWPAAWPAAHLFAINLLIVLSARLLLVGHSAPAIRTVESEAAHERTESTPQAQPAHPHEEEVAFEQTLAEQSSARRPPAAFLDPFGATFDDFLLDAQAARGRKRADETDGASSLGAGNETPLNDQATVASAGAVEAGEESLQFAWKQLATNKCSRTCGRGLRIYHISCVDLKYEVRVSDELCALKARTQKPGPTRAAEYCNEIDCPLAWLNVTGELELDDASKSPVKCNDELAPPPPDECRCLQIDARGARRHFEPSKCNRGRRPQETMNVSEAEASRPPIPEELEVSLDSLPASSSNEILQADEESPRFNSDASSYDPTSSSADEPQWRPLAWSECKASGCGLVGQRQRQLSCRMFLSRSAKSIELPASSCRERGAPEPETREPCYLDCAAQQATNSDGQPIESSAVDPANPGDLNSNEELVYDLEMSRYEWRQSDWSKCSAACLGGQRESLTECWDKVAGSPVDTSLCEPAAKPATRVEPCNQFACAPEWRIQGYGPCDKACGSTGLRRRFISCVQKRLINVAPRHQNRSLESDGPPPSGGERVNNYHYAIVPDELCLQSGEGGTQAAEMPPRLEACNRRDCPVEWLTGSWSPCDSDCGLGLRTRNVSCVQELAREPEAGATSAATTSAQLKGDSHSITIQLPFEKCYSRYKMVPLLEEACQAPCLTELYIDSHRDQQFTYLAPHHRGRKSITLRVGGRAQLSEGVNLKLRCKVMRRVRPNSSANRARHVGAAAGPELDKLPMAARATQALVKRLPVHVEWRFQAERMFPNGSNVSDKRPLIEMAPSSPGAEEIVDNDIMLSSSGALMNDQPAQPATQHKRHSHSGARPRRKLAVRSWPADSVGDLVAPHANKFQFAHDPQGRFSLIRENTLKIRRVRPDDSGIYTCSHGSLSESIELVVSPIVDKPQPNPIRSLNELPQ